MSHVGPMGWPSGAGWYRQVSEERAMALDDRLLTVQEVAAQMRVSSMTVYRLIKAGDLQARRIGHSYRLRVIDVEAYLEGSLR